MAGYRPERIAELIHREVSMLLMTNKDPRIGSISITKVEITRDLRKATLLYLPLGHDEAAEETQEGLNHMARQWRGPVGRALGIRHAPELHFQLDRHTVDAVRVASLLDKIGRDLRQRDGVPEEGAELDEADEDTDETEADEAGEGDEADGADEVEETS